MKRSFLIMFLMAAMFMSFASASIDYDTQSQTYIIDTIWPTWIGGNGQSQVHLIENTEKCLINCHFTIEFQNEEPVSLLEGLEFKDRNGNNVIDKIQNLNFQIGTYQNITTITPIYETQCTDIYNETNQTTSQQCEQTFIQYKLQNNEELIWQNYNGEDVDGLNYLRATATKSPMTSVDWIITFRGEELGEWAWWDGSWNYKRQLSNLTGNISALQFITYDAHMNADFSDLRFIDYATESIELNYTIETKSDSNWALVRINNLGANSVYMYYGNAGASDNSNASDVYFNPVSMYYLDGTSGAVLDSVGTNNGTNGGATRGVAGVINNSFDFEYADSDYAKSDANVGITGAAAWSMNAWIKVESFDTDFHNIFSLGTFGTANQVVSLAMSTTNERLQVNTWGGIGGVDINPGTTLSGNFVMTTMTYDGTNLKVYINGDSTPVYSTTGTLSLVDNAFYFGGRTGGYTGGNGQAFDGLMDEVGVWSKTLNIEEISALYNQTQPSFITGAEQQNSGSIAVDFVTPPTPTNNSEVTNFTVQVNATYTNSSLTNITYDFYNLNGTLTTFLYPNETYTFNGSILPEGAYDYNVTICGNETINNSVVCGSTTTRRILLDISPPVFNGTSPMGTYNYLKVNQTLDVNWTVIDEGVGLDSCWFIYNGVRTDVNCTANHSQIYYVLDVNTLDGYGNDTLGNEVHVALNWSYELVEINQTFSSPVLEESTETYGIHIKTTHPPVTSSVVIYNGTSHASTLNNLGGGLYYIVASFETPALETSTNFTFYHNTTLSNGLSINSSEQTQLVQAIELGNCSFYNYTMANFFLFDERTLLAIEGTIEANVDILDNFGNAIVSGLSQEFYNVTNASICTSVNLSGATNLFNFEIRYFSDPTNTSEFLYVPEFYHIQKGSTSSFPQNISLYDLSINESTEFTISYRDDNYQQRPGVLLLIERKYISEGIFRTVEIPITSNEGSAIGHFDLNNYKYRVTATLDGEILNIFNNPAIACESELSGQCTLTLDGQGSPAQYRDLQDIEDFYYIPSINGSDITIQYVIPSGSVKEVGIAMIQDTPFTSPNTLCNQTITSASGSLTCTALETIGDSQVFIYVTVDGKTYREVAYYQEDISTYFLLNNYAIAALIIIFVATMAISSPTIMIIASIVSFIYLGLAFLIRGTSIGVIVGAVSWLIVVAIVLITKISKKVET